MQRFFDASAANVASSSAGGAQSVVLAASASRRNYLAHVQWYTAAPLGGQELRVHDGTSTDAVIARVGISTGSALGGVFAPAVPMRGSVGRAMTVALSSGGAGLITLAAYGWQDR